MSSALAEVRGVGEALDLLEDLDLDRYHLFHATRAELLGRIGHFEEADRAYEQALALTSNPVERMLLEEKRANRLQP